MLRSSLGRQAFLLSLLALVAAGGCVSTATVRAWQPAEADIVGIRRLAVLDFRGPSNHGQIARSAVVAQLAGNGFYELVDQSQLGSVESIGGSPDVNQAIRAARAQGVDGLLVGDVVSYDVVDDVQRDQNIQFGGGSEKDGKADIAKTVMGMRVENNETINREVSAALSFQLIDVRSGNIVAARQTAHTDMGTMTNGEGYLPAAERALTGLMNLCAEDIVHIIAPHKVPRNVDLATASWGKAAKEIRAGNQCAHDSDWVAAAQHWEMALEMDPDSHGAMHNLALAREARMDYPGADRLVSQAIELKAARLYRQSRSRIERHKARYLTTMAQHDARSPRGPASPVYAGPQSAPRGSLAAPGTRPAASGASPAVQSAGHMGVPTNLPWAGNAVRR